MRRLLILGVCAGGLALGTAGCGGSLTSTEPTPTGTTTESFAGTLNPGGGTTHLFVSLAKGTITATLTSIGDDNTRVVGLGLGNWSNNTCNLSAASDAMIATLPMVASVTAAGNLCARVYDSQGIPDATAYTLQIIHP